MSKFLSVIVLWIFTLSLANALDDYTKDQVDNFVLSQIATGNNCAMIQSYFQTSLDGYIKSVNHALDCKGIYLNYIVSYAKTGSVSGSGSTVDCLVPMPNPDAFIGTMMNVVDMEDQEVVRLKDMYNAMSEQKREASSFCQKKVQVSTEK